MIVGAPYDKKIEFTTTRERGGRLMAALLPSAPPLALSAPAFAPPTRPTSSSTSTAPPKPPP
jgi:hypothetical protein